MFPLLFLLHFCAPVIFAFSFVHITDTHIGDGDPTKAHNDYAEIIEAINTKYPQVSFAIHTGDVTDTALPSQWSDAFELSQRLKVPYVPILGNHDIWSYNSTWEEEAPTGDRQFFETFRSVFAKKPLSMSNFTGGVRTPNPEHDDIVSYFQNFVIRYENVVFVCLDWVSRKSAAKVLGYKGGWPGTELHDFRGGTFWWLKSILSELAAEKDTIKKIFFVQHHPFRTPAYIPADIYSWSLEHKHKVADLITASGISSLVWGDVSGHLHQWHYWQDDVLEVIGKEHDFEEWQSAAVKDVPCFAIFTVNELSGDVESITKVILT